MSTPVILRVHTRQIKEGKPRERAAANTKPWYEAGWPGLVLVLDCETSTDETHRLLFAALRVYSGMHLVSEALVIGEGLPEESEKIIRDYARDHREGDIEGDERLAHTRLDVLNYRQFINLIMRVAYKYSGIITGFNLPFDISRIALGHRTPKKGFFSNGFVFHFNEYTKEGESKQLPSLYKPRIEIKALSDARPFASIMHPILNRKKERGGYILDLQNMTYALTEKKHSLQSACEEFGTEHRKLSVKEHGKITPEYIDYCRGDVLASWELYVKLLDEYRRHPVPTKPNRLFSTASLAKGYLKAMGVKMPPLEVDPNLNLSADQVFGFSMSAYFGGRAETRLQRLHLPVAYLDFLSMYPTVTTLMKLWRMFIAGKVTVIDDTENTKQFVDNITLEDLYIQSTWEKMAALVRIIPRDDFLPVREQHGDVRSNHGFYGIDWKYATSGDNEVELWYALPDVIASKITTGKAPQIVQTIRLVPSGVREGLQRTRLRGAVEIDPYRDDFFKKIVEERKRLENDTRLDGIERVRLDKTLKHIVNSLYGICVELNRNDSKGNRVNVQVYSKENFRSSAGWIEEPGAFFFPPVAAIITAGAHLMLAMLHHEVETARGGSYVFIDTDSIAIVVAAEHGPMSITDNTGERVDITALSYDEVEDIVRKFERLNPYDPRAVHGTILKVEDENKPLGDNKRALSYDPKTGEFEYVTGSDLKTEGAPVLYSYSVSSKRYALYNVINGRYILRKGTEASLAQYMFPGDTKKEWIKHFWLLAVGRGDFSIFKSLPLMTQFSITTAGLMKAFEAYNRVVAKDDYAAGVKPFDFFTHPVLKNMAGKPWRLSNNDGKENEDEEPKPVTLVAPYSGNPWDITRTKYINLHDPSRVYRVVMETSPGVVDLSRVDWDIEEIPTFVVRSMADMLLSYLRNPESGMVDRRGNFSTGRTAGPLYHASIEIGEVKYIGKETNLLDMVANGIVAPGDETLAFYTPDEWENEILPRLKNIPVYKIVKETGIDAGNISLYLSGKRRPEEDSLDKIKEALPRLDKYNEWEEDILPRVRRIPASEISRLTGLSKRHVNFLKSGKKQPGPETIEKLRIAICEYDKCYCAERPIRTSTIVTIDNSQDVV